MPIYEYKCTSCGTEFEEIVKAVYRESDQTCPRCEKKCGKYLDRVQKFSYSLNRSFSRMRHGQ
jgi:putative FmdB family regulatory protein